MIGKIIKYRAIPVYQIRLGEKDIQAIKKAFNETFLENDHLWIFGSRIDLQAKGGDIDLYVETSLPSLKEASEKKRNFVIKIHDAIGEQRIDVVVNPIKLENKIEQSIFLHAREKGVLLV